MSASAAVLRWRCATVIAAGTSLAAIGCTLLSTADLAQQVTASRPVLPPLKAPVDAVQLQVVFIERPADDPLVWQRLWQELDVVGGIPPETRTILDHNGLRVGQSGSHPPPTLQKLLGLTEQVQDGSSDDRQVMRGRRLGLRSAQETEIQTVDDVRDATILYRLPGKDESVDYEQSRAVLKVAPIRVQEGWVRMEFAPEIHHGLARLRHTPTDDGWALKGGQKCDARFAMRFQTMLNNGEMMVISGQPELANSLGHRLFCYEIDGRKMQRLLVLRLADSGRSETDSALRAP